MFVSYCQNAIKKIAYLIILHLFSAVLEEHRKQCEMEGKYVEAEMAKNRIEELKVQDYNRRREQLVYDQARERDEVEQAHLMEYQDFNKRWDEALAQIE